MPRNITTIGKGSQRVTFYHPSVGSLHVKTGIDEVSWGYELNTASFPTYGGEVVQILSCYVSDLTVGGTLLNYHEMEFLYSYFIQYLKVASSPGRKGLERPMHFTYDHRKWDFDIIVTGVPGYRKARDLVAPEWRLEAHIVDEAGDVDLLSELIIEEANFQSIVGAGELFGTLGKVGFVDENPFSDPNTKQLNFTRTLPERLKDIGDYYAKLIPAYLDADFDTMFNGIGSKPAFDPRYQDPADEDPSAPGVGTTDKDEAFAENPFETIVKAQKQSDKANP